MPRRRLLMVILVAGVAAVLVACEGEKGISLDKADRDNASMKRGALLFAQRCGGCHSLSATGSEGSGENINDRERVDGPNFDTRTEEASQVLYAIQNGGFSGALMPQNIVVGQDAKDVAQFLAKYAGREAKTPKGPSPGPAGEGF